MRRLRSITLGVAAIGALLGAQTLAAQTLTNDDVIKLANAGLSESFILNLIDEQGSKLATDVSSLIAMKSGGVNERLISAAVARSSAPTEALNTDSVLRLVQAGFSDGFISNLIDDRQGAFAVPATRIIELKNEGVSERLLSKMVVQGGRRELASGTEITIRMIDSIDSEIDRVGDEFRASLDVPITIGDEVVAARGAKATVRLAEAEESGKLRGRTALTLELVDVEIDGKMVAVNGGGVSQTSGSRGARTAKSAAVVSAIGAAIGAAAGGGKGAAIGAAAGAGAGAGAQIFLDPQRVKVPSEQLLTFITEQPAVF